MKRIPLNHGFYALVDDADFAELSKYSWHYKQGYAVRTENYYKEDGNRSCRTIRMHRELLNTPPGYDTDHANCDKLDNRRANLRVATRQQNAANQRATSGYKGVYKQFGRWKVMLARKYIGLFKTDVEAARAYNKAALERYGEFARLNDV